MNSNVNKLHAISLKPKRYIIGLMSGTSLDGLDIALCEFSGCRNQQVSPSPLTGLQIKLVHFETVPYKKDVQDVIRSIFCRSQVSLQNICVLNPWIGNLHADMVLSSLRKWGIKPEEVDLIASHGQTIYHAPKSLHGLPNMPNSTLQIGDGDHIAVKTGIITLCDFRQKNIAAGGEGAPLALYGDFLLFSKPGEDRIMLNIGGIANFTYLPADGDFSRIFCTDTGPGNTLIDAHVQKYFGEGLENRDLPNNTYELGYDKGGQIAKNGAVNPALLSELNGHPFFKETHPPKAKTTGQELFNVKFVERAQEISGTVRIGQADVIATLTRFSAETISQAIRSKLQSIVRIDGNHPLKCVKIFASGGGKHNKVLMEHLMELLPFPIFEFSEFSSLGFSPDAKEAILFATLANESICGQSTEELARKNKTPWVSMGKICFPS